MTKKLEQPLFNLTLHLTYVICQIEFGQAYNTCWNQAIEAALFKSYGLRKLSYVKNPKAPI